MTTMTRITLLLLTSLSLLIIHVSSSSSSSSSYQCPISSTPVQIRPDDKEIYSQKPYIDGTYSFINGDMIKHKGLNFDVITSPIIDSETGQRTVIGKLSSMNGSDS